MQKAIKIYHSMEADNFTMVDDIIISLNCPYSENDVAVEINSNITDYQKKLKFDFKDNKTHNFQVENNSYEMQLTNIEKNSQGFLSFEFVIT